MIRSRVAALAIVACPCVCVAGQAGQPVPPAATPPPQLKAFLDCRTGCFSDFLRAEVTFVDYVRDRGERTSTSWSRRSRPAAAAASTRWRSSA